MQIFYTANISGDNALFSHSETAHCLKVLRKRRGDSVFFTDGKGKLYEGIIINDDLSGMTVSITSAGTDNTEQNYKLHVAISPLKNEDRLEWFIEKAVETGVYRITPLICNHTEKKRIRKERLEGIALSAMKQSVRCFLPTIDDLVTFDEFIRQSHNGKRLIACCDEETERISITSAFNKGEDVTIMIGPEGDFTAEEIKTALNEGFCPVHLGRSRLRTETAGITACCSVYLANI